MLQTAVETAGSVAMKVWAVAIVGYDYDQPEILSIWERREKAFAALVAELRKHTGGVVWPFPWNGLTYFPIVLDAPFVIPDEVPMYHTDGKAHDDTTWSENACWSGG